MTEFWLPSTPCGAKIHRNINLVVLLRNASVRNARLVVSRSLRFRTTVEPPPTFPFLESQCQRTTSSANFHSTFEAPPLATGCRCAPARWGCIGAGSGTVKRKNALRRSFFIEPVDSSKKAPFPRVPAGLSQLRPTRYGVPARDHKADESQAPLLRKIVAQPSPGTTCTGLRTGRTVRTGNGASPHPRTWRIPKPGCGRGRQPWQRRGPGRPGPGIPPPAARHRAPQPRPRP